MKQVLLIMLLFLSVTLLAQKPALTKVDYEETSRKTALKKQLNTPISKDSPELQYFDFEVIAKDKVKITKCHIDWQEVEIPASVVSNGYKFIVTELGDSAFYNKEQLKTITIPNSITSMGRSVFQGCSSLTSVTIPNSVISIGNHAFDCCSSLTSATIPNSVKSIGDYVFSDCSSLTSITIPNGVTSIGKSAFASCSSLTSITIPNGVTSIEMSAFFNCSSLTSITIPNSVTSIEPNAFYGCSSLTSITIPNSVTSIGDETFFNCSSLTSITIPEGVTTIGKLPFRGCSSLDSITWNAVNCSIDKPFEGIAKNIKSFTFGQDVTNIPDFLCDDMSSLTNITIPANVKTIGKHVFRKCDNISSVTWNAVNCEPTSWSDNSSYYYGPFYDIRDNIEIFNIGENVVILPAYLCFQLGIKTLIIPQSVTTIGDFFIGGNDWWRRNMTILFKGKVKFTGCITGNADTFKGTTTIVYVPNNYLDYYKSIRKQVGFKYADIKPQ